jgi:hypothetical protein
MVEDRGRKIDHRVDRDFVTNAMITASSEAATGV